MVTEETFGVSIPKKPSALMARCYCGEHHCRSMPLMAALQGWMDLVHHLSGAIASS